MNLAVQNSSDFSVVPVPVCVLIRTSVRIRYIQIIISRRQWFAYMFGSAFDSVVLFSIAYNPTNATYWLYMIEFLSDLKQVELRDSESQYRVSGEFLGSPQLTNEEIEAILKQRKSIAAWSLPAAPTSHVVLAESAQMKTQQAKNVANVQQSSASKVCSGLSVEGMNRLLSVAPSPGFDEITSDVWSRRIHTAQSFTRIVSKCILRNRVQRRLDLLQRELSKAGVRNKKDCELFVERENAEFKTKGSTAVTDHKSGVKSASGPAASSLESTSADGTTKSAAEVFASRPNEVLAAIEHSVCVQRDVRYAPSPELFVVHSLPRHLPSFDRPSSTPTSTEQRLQQERFFKDRTELPVLQTPYYKAMGYAPIQPPALGVWTRSGCRAGVHPRRARDAHKGRH